MRVPAAPKAVWPAQLQHHLAKTEALTQLSDRALAGEAWAGAAARPGVIADRVGEDDLPVLPCGAAGTGDALGGRRGGSASGEGAADHGAAPRSVHVEQARSIADGAQVLPYAPDDLCCLMLRWPEGSSSGETSADFSERTYFVTSRLGPVLLDGSIKKEESVKLIGTWTVGSGNLVWVVRNAPLQEMASKSPLGLVGFRFKLWLQGPISRTWVGRTCTAAVPSAPQTLYAGSAPVCVAAYCGARADFVMRTMASPNGEVAGLAVEQENASSKTREVPMPRSAELGREALRAASERKWEVVTLLLSELRLATDAEQRLAATEADQNGRTVLRLGVDGQLQEPAGIARALEHGTLTVVLGVQRPYWWCMRFDAVSETCDSFVGEVRLGVPRTKSAFASAAAALARPWDAAAALMATASAGPSWEDLQWSEPLHCGGEIMLAGPEAEPEHLAPPAAADASACRAKFRFNGVLRTDTAELRFFLVAPRESVNVGTETFSNPLQVPMLAVSGSVAGASATGVLDPLTCTRLAAMLEGQSGCGVGEIGRSASFAARTASSLAAACGADPRALADDGLSPYTAALFGQDPCGLLDKIDLATRVRLRRGDELAWAEAGRSSAGADHADLVAAPIARGLAVPEELARRLLDYCFKANLPLLAVRVLSRMSGEAYLAVALERADDKQWLRAAERILQQLKPSVVRTHEEPPWCHPEVVSNAIEQIRKGRHQFSLFLRAYLDHVHARCAATDFVDEPAALTGGGCECPICFDPLVDAQPVAFAANGHIVCPHFLCSGCASSCTAAASNSSSVLRCPECRREAVSMEPLPPLMEDPLRWLDFLATPEGSIARSALLRALSAVLPIDANELGEAIDAGTVPGGPVEAEVEAADFLTRGLYVWVWRHRDEHLRVRARGPQPALAKDRAAWFRHWNFSNTGVLRLDEVFRGALRLTGVSSMEKERVQRLRELVRRAWTRSGEERRIRRCRSGDADVGSISLEDFVARRGLGELLEEALRDEFPASVKAADVDAGDGVECDKASHGAGSSSGSSGDNRTKRASRGRLSGGPSNRGFLAAQMAVVGGDGDEADISRASGAVAVAGRRPSRESSASGGSTASLPDELWALPRPGGPPRPISAAISGQGRLAPVVATGQPSGRTTADVSTDSDSNEEVAPTQRSPPPRLGFTASAEEPASPGPISPMIAALSALGLVPSPVAGASAADNHEAAMAPRRLSSQSPPTPRQCPSEFEALPASMQDDAAAIPLQQVRFPQLWRPQRGRFELVADIFREASLRSIHSGISNSSASSSLDAADLSPARSPYATQRTRTITRL
eukprot:TRINITY_DN26814_c0_g2_i1.p1 TRINITY_DN26814_c0_g2~~TRINITY_DN26814_c0_g2_i1.p1  ORF type:complete len:1319 (-),score=268.34 TRINITY_DN26814_c0_g2_i1:681-4637(-)